MNANKKVLILTFCLTLVTSCSTQTGNPGALDVTTDENLFGTALTSVFDSLVSSSKAGDYAYASKIQSIQLQRVCTARTGGYEVNGTGSTVHSLTEDLTLTTAEIDLELDRIEVDQWSDSTTSCENNVVALSSATAELTSKVEQGRSRDLELVYKGSDIRVVHNSTFTEEGTRELSLTKVENSVNVELDLNITKRITTMDSTGKERAFNIMIDSEQRLRAIALLGEDLAINSYTLSGSDIAVRLPDGKRVALTFDNVILTSGNGCYPTSGTISGTFDDETSKPLSIDFSEGESASFLFGESSLPFLPQGCQFSEL